MVSSIVDDTDLLSTPGEVQDRDAALRVRCFHFVFSAKCNCDAKNTKSGPIRDAHVAFHVLGGSPGVISLLVRRPMIARVPFLVIRQTSRQYRVFSSCTKALCNRFSAA